MIILLNDISKEDKKIVVIVLFIIDVFLTLLITPFVWNHSIAPMFELKNIGVLEGWILALAITYIFSWKHSTKKRNIDEYIDLLLDDIVFTIFIWLMIAILSLFAF